MQRLLLCMVGVMVICSCGAQTWEEWTEQKRTQLKYLANAIAANKVYIEYAKKGYDLVSGGLETIRSIKDGDFKIHQLFFDELVRVNPAIKRWSVVPAVVESMLRVTRIVSAIERQVTHALLHAAERNHIVQFCKGMRQRCTNGLDDMMVLLTDGQISMKDDERIQRITQIYTQVTEWVAVATDFAHDLHALLLQREQELHSINYSKFLRQ